jgi:hypothetical protein
MYMFWLLSWSSGHTVSLRFHPTLANICRIGVFIFRFYFICNACLVYSELSMILLKLKHLCIISSNGATMVHHFGGGGRGGTSNLKKEAKNSVETSEGGKK